MNASHYPDIERCKKLTELGFPQTFGHYTASSCKPTPELKDYYYVCPSVMEMLDVIPKIISESRLRIKSYETWYSVRYQTGIEFVRSFDGTLPNALADMVIWLAENKYLTFNK